MESKITEILVVTFDENDTNEAMGRVENIVEGLPFPPGGLRIKMTKDHLELRVPADSEMGRKIKEALS